MDDWAVGDLALCIKQGSWASALDSTALGVGPRCGAILTVRSVGVWQGLLVLWFNEWPGAGLDNGFVADRFIKVTPPEADEFDAEVLFDLKYRPSPAFTDPTAGELEAVCGSSLRSATFPRLTGGLFGQSIQNARGSLSERDASTAALIIFPHEGPNA